MKATVPEARGYPCTILLAGLLLATPELVLAGPIGLSLVNVNINIAIPGQLVPSPSPGVLTPPAYVTYVETPTSASLTIVGGDFDSDSQQGATITGSFWTTSFYISQDAGVFNDVLSLNGTFQHIAAPHPGDLPFGSVFIFNFVLNADDAVAGKVTGSKTQSLPHLGIGHSDNYEAVLRATVSSTLWFDDITGWTFALQAQHVPEPSCLLLVATAIAAFALLRIWRGWLRSRPQCTTAPRAR